MTALTANIKIPSAGDMKIKHNEKKAKKDKIKANKILNLDEMRKQITNDKN